MTKRLDRIEVQPFGMQKPFTWRWHKRAPNGEILSQGEGHKRWDHAVRAAHRANQGCSYELTVRNELDSGVKYYEQVVDGAYYTGAVTAKKGQGK